MSNRRTCAYCGSKFEISPKSHGGQNRSFCYECYPAYLNLDERIEFSRLMEAAVKKKQRIIHDVDNTELRQQILTELDESLNARKKVILSNHSLHQTVPLLYDEDLVHLYKLNPSIHALEINTGVTHDAIIGAFIRENFVPYNDKQHVFSASVDMLDLDGNYQKTFHSVQEAINYLDRQEGRKTKGHGHIGEVCTGKRATYRKHRWRYTPDTQQYAAIKEHNSGKLLSLDDIFSYREGFYEANNVDEYVKLISSNYNGMSMSEAQQLLVGDYVPILAKYGYH